MKRPWHSWCFLRRSSSRTRALPAGDIPTGVPNELSAQEVPYEMLLGIHRSTILPDSAGPLQQRLQRTSNR